MQRLGLAVAALLLSVPDLTSALGTNSLLNPDFNTSFTGWGIGAGTSPALGSDVDGCAASRSLAVNSVNVVGEEQVVVCQCLAVPSGTLRASFWAFSDGAESIFVIIAFFSSSDCSGNSLDLVGYNPTSGGWVQVTSSPATFPGQGSSANFCMIGSSAVPYTLSMDRAFFGSANEIFVDNFEVGETCRW